MRSSARADLPAPGSGGHAEADRSIWRDCWSEWTSPASRSAMPALERPVADGELNAGGSGRRPGEF